MAAAVDAQSVGKPPPRLSGGWPVLGHLLELRRDPLALMWRLREECGEVGVPTAVIISAGSSRGWP